MIPAITFGSMGEWQNRVCMLLWFSAQIMHQQMRYPMQLERLEANKIMEIQEDR
jgi:hypothetical protein